MQPLEVPHFSAISGEAQANELLKIVSDNASLGLVMMDERQHCIFMNPTAEEIFGFSFAEVKARNTPLHNIIHHARPDGSHYPMEECPIDRALPTKSKTTGEDVFVRKDGSFYPVAFTASPILKRGKPIGTVIEVRDTSEEKKAQRHRDHLIALNKAKDEFISLASHQLRTPATGVKQYIGMLIEGYADDLTPNQRELLEIAYESNERQLQIVNDLLKVARVDAGQVKLHVEWTDLVPLIKDIVGEQASGFKRRKQKISFTHSAPKLVVNVDPERIRMALENIVDNASKYTPEGKTINIRAGLSPAKDVATITIQDQGVGIAAKDISKLFQKFVRLDNPLSTKVGGSGLGLYWSKHIVDLHGGTIAVSSKVGTGTTFRVDLPVS